jgi:hypothetical protein
MAMEKRNENFLRYSFDILSYYLILRMTRFESRAEKEEIAIFISYLPDRVS